MTLELTDAERRLIDAVREGELACYNCGDPVTDDPRNGDTWCGGRIVRAEVIRTLLTESNSLWRTHFRGIDVRGARIVGQLYLGGAVLKCRLALIDCRIDECLNLADTSAPSIALTGSYLCGGVQAERIVVHGSLFLDAIIARAEIKLVGANISGN